MNIARIPAKYRERVEAIEDDRGGDNGWWIHLRDGWICDTSAAPHTIHEDTIAECLRCLRESRPEFIFNRVIRNETGEE